MGKPEVESPLSNYLNNIMNVKCPGNNNTSGNPDGGPDMHSDVPGALLVFSNQVAGHMVQANGQFVGMLKQNGLVFKPILKKDLGEREIHFYRTLEESSDKMMIELKNLVPSFYGTEKVSIMDKEYECIVLEDLTKYYKEPCIMDIKIGRRVWDPDATYTKIVSEENKYRECRRDLSFCIPGFQIYSVTNKQLSRYGKEFGKSLNKERAIDAIRAFLNYDNKGFCRSLIVQFLAALWRIQNWARNQRRFRLFSSSILLVYDAKRLRENMPCDIPSTPTSAGKTCLYRPMSIATLNSCERIPTGFSGLLTKEGPILNPTSSNKIVNLDVPVCLRGNNSWQKSIHTLKRTHSFQNNYDKDVQNRKQNYLSVLDELSTDQNSECWAAAKMIDFAHVYPSENCHIDENYLEGIDNLVKIFEDFLAESV